MFDILYIEKAYQELKDTLPQARQQLQEGLEHYSHMEWDQDCEEFAQSLAGLSLRIQLSEKRLRQLKFKRQILFS